VTRPTVALATCAAWPELDDDGPALLAALRTAGVDPAVAVWDDAAVDWTAYDLVVVRTTWDYWDRLADYLAWAAAVPRLANPVEVLRWNTDKRYLRDLADRGVPVVPTTFLAPGDAFAAPDGEYVVKPSVSAGSQDTARFGPGEQGRAAELAARIGAAGKHVMVQPYVAAVDDVGETSVLSFGGVVSHAIRKGQILHPGAGVLEQPPGLEVISERVASDAERAVADAAVAATADVLGLPGPLLYARVDMVPGPDGPLVLELEVTEPSLFLGYSEGAAARFASAVAELVGA
jgi:glutathione synthase/RimK-type ligase-like ATP-grasp enzyme